MHRILIFANGEIPDLEKARTLVQPDDFILCADGGTRHALALGRRPDLVVGDMDSLEQGQWQELEKDGVRIELYPHDKNETDLELAITHAIEMAPEEILIIGALGGRLDQTIGNLGLLADDRLASFKPRIDDGVEAIAFCRDHVVMKGSAGDIVSLIPWHGPVDGIHTKGLKWPLKDEVLYPGRTRGISNEMTGTSAGVRIRSGLLLVVHRRS